MPLPTLLKHLGRLACAISLASCMVDERSSWDNPDDPSSTAWTAHSVTIVAPGFYPVDTLFLEEGTRLNLYQTYSGGSAADSTAIGSWSFRDLVDGTKFSIAGGPHYSTLDTLLPLGSWRVHALARSSHGTGGIYDPDSMVLVVAPKGARPQLRLPADTTVFFGATELRSGLAAFTLPLQADDPFGRDVKFSYVLRRESGELGPWRWTPNIEFSDVDTFGDWRVLVECMNSVGLSDTGSFLVRVRLKPLLPGG